MKHISETHTPETDKIRAESAELRHRITAGEICAYCHQEGCDRVVSVHRLQVGSACSAAFVGCRKRFDLEQAKITNIRDIEREQSAEALRVLAYIPERFADKGFDGFEKNLSNGLGFAMAWRYADQLRERMKDGRGLLFIGPTGTGKTHLAVAILQAALLQYIPCRYFYAPKLLDVLREKTTDPTLGRLAFDAIYEQKPALLDQIRL